MSKPAAAHEDDFGRWCAALQEQRATIPPVERIPLADDSVDTVFSTLTFCSIPDLPRALSEMRRMLRLGGELLFFEHGLHPDPNIAAGQRRGEARHKWISNGCHQTRDISSAIEAAGFTFLENHAGERVQPRYEQHRPREY